MFRAAPRTLLRASARRPFPRVSPSRRFLSTSPSTQKSRSWKSSAVRWGLAGGAVYWYSTTNVFAEQPTYIVPPIPETENDTEQLPTLETISAQRKQRQQSFLSEPSATSSTVAAPLGKEDGPAPGSPEELEEEADQQGAFNPETGEINWDCPCLGGIAHGPCGEEFKLAFSCFVYSKEEPKGMDCIDKFKGMQDCFRQHPDVYGEEMEDENDMSAEDADAPATPQPAFGESAVTHHPSGRTEKVATKSDPEPERVAKRERAKKAAEQVKKEHAPLDESDEAAPKAWHDTTSSSEGK